jgi:RNA polymerase sigma-70 factor (ECF subfamily)
VRANRSKGWHDGAVTSTQAYAAAEHDEALDAVRARLHAFIQRRVESAEIAEDLTQEVLLRMVVASEHAPMEKPSRWLFRVARNAIIDHYRARSTRGRTVVATERRAEPADDPFAEDPEAAQRELAVCLGSLVDQLEEPYRGAVAAADLEGQSQTALARAAGVSVSGMKSRVQRGRRQLRRLLTEYCRVRTAGDGGVMDYDPAVSCHQAVHADAGACRCAPEA